MAQMVANLAGGVNRPEWKGGEAILDFACPPPIPTIRESLRLTSLASAAGGGAACACELEGRDTEDPSAALDSHVRLSLSSILKYNTLHGENPILIQI